MKYEIDGNKIILSEPLRRYKNGIKVLFYLHEDVERASTDYPVAYADTNRGQCEFYLPSDSVKVFELLVKTPRYKLFPFIWHKWVRAESLDLLTNT